MLSSVRDVNTVNDSYLTSNFEWRKTNSLCVGHRFISFHYNFILLMGALHFFVYSSFMFSKNSSILAFPHLKECECIHDEVSQSLWKFLIRYSKRKTSQTLGHTEKQSRQMVWELSRCACACAYSVLNDRPFEMQNSEIIVYFLMAYETTSSLHLLHDHKCVLHLKWLKLWHNIQIAQKCFWFFFGKPSKRVSVCEMKLWCISPRHRLIDVSEPFDIWLSVSILPAMQSQQCAQSWLWARTTNNTQK